MRISTGRIRWGLLPAMMLLVFAALLAADCAFAQSSECGKDRKVGTKALDELTTEQICETVQQVAGELSRRSEQLTGKGQRWGVKVAKAAAVDIEEMVISLDVDQSDKSGESDVEGDPPAEKTE